MNASNRQTIDTYNLAVDKYIDSSPQTISRELQVWIDDNLSHINSDAKILEIGSGFGRDAEYITSHGYTVEMTDASQSFVDHLKNNGHAVRLLNIITDAIDSGYDIIFADAVFLHFTEQELISVLNKTYQALKDGGRLAFTLKVGDGEETTTRKMDAPRYFHYWQQPQIEALLFTAGFSEIYIKSDNDFRGIDKPDWLYVNAVRH